MQEQLTAMSVELRNPCRQNLKLSKHLDLAPSAMFVGLRSIRQSWTEFLVLRKQGVAVR